MQSCYGREPGLFTSNFGVAAIFPSWGGARSWTTSCDRISPRSVVYAQLPSRASWPWLSLPGWSFSFRSSPSFFCVTPRGSRTQ